MPEYQPPVDDSDDESDDELDGGRRGMTPRQMARNVLEPKEWDTTTGPPATSTADMVTPSAVQEDTMIGRLSRLEDTCSTMEKQMDHLCDELARTRAELKDLKAQQVPPISGAEATPLVVDSQLPSPLDL